MSASLEDLSKKALELGYKLTKIRVSKPKAPKPVEDDKDYFIMKKGQSYVCLEGKPAEKDKQSNLFVTDKKKDVLVFAKYKVVELPEESDDEEETN